MTITLCNRKTDFENWPPSLSQYTSAAGEDVNYEKYLYSGTALCIEIAVLKVLENILEKTSGMDLLS